MEIIDLYHKYTSFEPQSVTPLTPAGSSRRYYRLSGHVTLIGVEGRDRQENEAFIYLSRHLMSIGANVPQVLAVSDDGMSYLVNDLGDTSLFSMKDDIRLLEKAMAQIALVHERGTEGMNWDKCFPVSSMDARAVKWDLNYFKYSFLNTEAIAYSEPKLENDFALLAANAEREIEESGVLMLRDFQSRNVMIQGGEAYLIDFQGARRGPRAYDLASFLWQAKAAFSDDVRRHLVKIYVEECNRLGGKLVLSELFSQVREMALLRSLQVLGAYGLRGRFERKPHFLQSIPKALQNVKALVADGACDDYLYLREVLLKVIDKEEAIFVFNSLPPYNGLTVTITSFSFKKGIPVDDSGNGGGFVFDCRAMDNPGRYEPYKKLTGLDRPVIDFLEGRGEIQIFLKECYALVDNAIDNYLERGFTSLMVNYGCTGGQHRSVYSAQHTAEFIHARFPHVRVNLIHRERGLQTIFEPQ